MANYYNLYKKAIIDELTKPKTIFYPGQLLKFRYGFDPGIRLVVVIGEWEGKLHCLKLNEVRPAVLVKQFRFVLSKELITRYELAISYGIYDEAFKLNKYKLPVTIPKFNNDSTAESFYNKVVKNSPILKTGKVYRTYDVDKLKGLRVIVPDLQKLGFLDTTITRVTITESEKSKFLSNGKEVDDYSKTSKLDKQDE